MRRVQIGQIAQSLLKRRLPKRHWSPLQQQPQCSFQSLSSGVRSAALCQNHDEFSQHAEAKEQAKAHERQLRDEEELLKTRMLNAGLQFVPSLGWSREALQAGAVQIGYPPTMSNIVPDADLGLVHHHYKACNDALELEMQKQVESARAQNQPIRIGPFLKQNIQARLRMNIPYLPKWPQALAIMSHPTNAPQSLYFGLQLVDSLWYFAGDKSTDFNWYTKRLSLLAIYKTTELAMMQDKSEDFEDTWKFLDRRFEDQFNLSSFVSNCSSNDMQKVIGGLGSTFKTLLGISR